VTFRDRLLAALREDIDRRIMRDSTARWDIGDIVLTREQRNALLATVSPFDFTTRDSWCGMTLHTTPTSPGFAALPTVFDATHLPVAKPVCDNALEGQGERAGPRKETP
jgi:hypothetical protein